MSSDEIPSLELYLNKATNPANREVDKEAISSFCDQVNDELEGPQVAVKLIAHKIQSPQEREALFSLTLLESCVTNCGKRFHQEIGKFRFLNEVIKVISPKYLGNHTTEKVKDKCISLLFEWSQGLKSEKKIAEAYDMLKKQKIISQDPAPQPQTFEPFPVLPRDENPIFKDEDKSKLLARLLKSKSPEDLQAANRLIKNMVKQDAERTEKVSRRLQEIETVGNNVKLLMEMLVHCKTSSPSEDDRQIMNDLYENLKVQRPMLFRLASDTEENDSDGLNQILKANDAVMKVMDQYKALVEDRSDESNLLSESSPTAAAPPETSESVTDQLAEIFSTLPSSKPQVGNTSTLIEFGAFSQSMDNASSGFSAFTSSKNASKQENVQSPIMLPQQQPAAPIAPSTAPPIDVFSLAAENPTLVNTKKSI